ncbi:MAG TPA: ABC transporter permease [Pyrinomonadaceae bacterium]|nr:ABC transporter permease [Pyrinomonadaceae bacterium]
MKFIKSFQSEWLKKKRSLASWLVVVGAFFTPLIILLSRFKNRAKLPEINVMDDFWVRLWNQSWESMTVLMLPVGIILATGLITQIEYKNNAWKQLHTTPQSYTTIFFAKLAVIFVMMIEVFVLFNLGMYLSAIVPSMVLSNVPYPSAPIPFEYFLQKNLVFFVECLPILALQYLISLQFKNFLVPIGAGFVIWILGIGLLSWEYSFIFPYVHSGIEFMIMEGHFKRVLPVNLQMLSIIYFAVFIAAGYVLYLLKKEKG